MEEHPRGREAGTTTPVPVVADDRMADRRQVDPDLVGATGLEPALAQRHVDRVGEELSDLVAGARLLAPRAHRHPGGLTGRATDRCVDEARRRLRMAPDQRQVAPLDLACRQHGGERGRRPPTSGPPGAAPTCPCRAGARCPVDRGRRPWRSRDSGRAAPARACRRRARHRGARRVRAACRRRSGRDPRGRRAPSPSGSAARASRRGAGSTATVMWSPSSTRAERDAAVVPLREIRPSSIQVTTSAREAPVIIATTRSRRSPASAAGTSSSTDTSVRRPHGLGVLGPSGGARPCCRSPGPARREVRRRRRRPWPGS